MLNSIIKSFEIWSTTQVQKSNGRGRSSDSIIIYGINRLRELILDLAIRGKLVPQYPNEEPASILLERIQAEKVKLNNEEKTKKQYPLVPEVEKPYKLPNGWEWTRIANIGHDWGQKTPDNDFTYIDVSGIDNALGIIKTPKILTANEAPSRARKIVKMGTVIFSTVRPYLKNIAIVDEEFKPEPIASTAFAIIHPYLEMSGKYFIIFFRSPVFIKYVESVQAGIAYPAINDKQFFGGIMPIPPFEEQHRIVAKVDELMALCDKLEQQQTNSLETHQLLVEILLKSLTNVKDAAELKEAWQQIESNFGLLFTTEESIDLLKQTILQLAVMGKLTQQNPSDEPASELLKQIAKEKARLVKEGKIKKQATLPEITDDEKPFDLPEGWMWVRLNDAIDVRDGTHDTPKDATGENTYPLVTSKNFDNGSIKFEEAKRISAEDHFEISKRSNVERFDILFSMIGGNLGNQVMVNNDRPFSIKNVALFKYYNKEYTSPFFIKKIMEHVAIDLQKIAIGGAQPFVSLGFLRNMVIPFPPHAEQHRIVTKVDELFALCDTLKERIIESQEIKVKMADAVVVQAAN